MMRDSCTHDRQPWRASGQPWPPHEGPFGTNRRARVRFFRRLAFVAIALLFIAVSSMLAAAWLIAGRIGDGRPVVPILVMMILFGGVAVLVTVFGAMRRFASPLGTVMEAADRVAEGDYGVRVQAHGPPAMRALARSFNTMTERLQNADRVRRNVMADVAHELRTPLSVLQGRLEGLIDGIYPRDDRQLGELLEETRVLARLIEDLRTLALSDAGALTLQREPTDLVGLVHEVVRSMRSEADRKSVAIDLTSSAETAIANLDPVRIREVLTNLVSNALQHSTAGGTVTISVRETIGGVALIVRDTGPGMSAEETARIFDRFYKGSESRGSGLGLAIAKSIVTAHGGDIKAATELGRGTSLEFTLPR